MTTVQDVANEREECGLAATRAPGARDGDRREHGAHPASQDFRLRPRTTIAPSAVIARAAAREARLGAVSGFQVLGPQSGYGAVRGAQGQRWTRSPGSPGQTASAGSAQRNEKRLPERRAERQYQPRHQPAGIVAVEPGHRPGLGDRCGPCQRHRGVRVGARAARVTPVGISDGRSCPGTDRYRARCRRR